MQIKSAALGAVVALGLVGSAYAQSDLVDGSNVDEILNLARGYGSATLDTQDNGDPMINGKVDGIGYVLFFQNCTDNKNCEDVRFYAGFADNKPTMDAINAWNRDKRFGKALLDSDLDAVIEYDINLEHGISSENMDANIYLWTMLLGQFTTYIGY
jgi:hypothetical protein